MIDSRLSTDHQPGIFRVRLRDPRVSDASLIFRWRQEELIKAHQPIYPLTLEQIQNDLEYTRANNLSDHSRERFQWIVERNADAAAIGWTTLSIRSWEHRIAEIGYSLSSEFQRQGYGKEMLKLLLKKAFVDAELYRIEAKCSVHNHSSGRLLEKTGFQREGTLREYFNIRGKRVDHYLYSLVRTDGWRP